MRLRWMIRAGSETSADARRCAGKMQPSGTSIVTLSCIGARERRKHPPTSERLPDQKRGCRIYRHTAKVTALVSAVSSNFRGGRSGNQ